MADEDIGSLAVKLALDDSSFQQGLQNLKRSMSVIDSSFKSSIAGVKDWGKNLDSMKNNATALGEKIGLQKQILQTYSEQLEKSKKSLEDNAKSMMDLKTKVDEAKTAWQEAAVEEGKDAEATQNLKKAYEDLNKQYTDAETKVRNNQKSIDGYSIQVNNATAKLKSMESQLSSVNRQIALQSSSWVSAGTYISQAGEKVKTLGEGFTNVGENLSTHVTLPIVAGLTAATLSASNFKHQMADIGKEIAAKGEDVNSVMSQMSDSSIKWSEDFGQSTDKVDEGLLTLVKDGYSGSESLSAMKISLDTARGANEDLETTVDTLGSSLEAYGMKTNDAATTTANMSHMADVFAYTANHTKASISGLGESFSIVGPLASQLKIPMEQVAAAIGELQSNGIDANTAATALQAGLVNLTKPTKKMQTQLDLMKFSAFDSTGKMKDLTTIIAEMSQKTAGWTDKQREAAYATIFGKESLATWGILMHKGSDYLGELSSNANNATGEVKRLSDSMKNTPQNNLKELEESVKALGIAFGEDVLPTLIPIVKQATEAVKSFSSLDDSTKKMIITIAGVAAVVGPALVAAGKVITAIGAIEKGVGGLLTWIGKKTAANITDTASTAANTVATNINTAAQEANAKARGETAASEGISTAAKEASTAAETENTAATVANDAAQGKSATGILGAAKNFLGLGTAAGTAGEAIAGTGAAAGEASGAMAGAGTVAGGTAAAGLGIFAVAAGAVALSGYGIYKAYKAATDQTIHQTDLFADDVEQSTQRVKDANGQMATEVQQETVTISKATKDKVSAYMDMDKKVSKSMMDVYVNANNFSKQEKDTVVSQYTQMVNQVTSLTGSNKTATINNFKQLVSNTTDLTKQNRSEIVSEYSNMVNQVTGLTSQQKQKVIKDFSDSLTQASGITKTQATGIINQFKQMGDKINSAIDQTDQSQIKKVQDLFSKTTTITNQEQSDILNKMQHSDAAKKSEANIYEQQITDIMTKAMNNHGKITQQDWQTMNDIKQRMQNLAIQSMSSTEVEAKVILQRMKDYNGKMTDQQASDTIINAEKQRKGAVDAADKQYNDKLAIIIKMRDQDHMISSQEADDMIKEAKRQRDKSVDEADGMKQDVVKKVGEMNADVIKNMDTSSGKMLSPWQQFEKSSSEIINDIGVQWDGLIKHIDNTNPKSTGSFAIGAGATIGKIKMNAAGGVFKQATRVNLAGDPDNVVGEAGNEAVIPLKPDVLADIGKGIFEASKKVNNQLEIQLPDSSKQSMQYGQKMMENIAEGMKSKTELVANATGNISSTIDTTMSQSAKDIFSGFKNQLTDSVDVVNNKAIAVSSTLSNMVMPERNLRSSMWTDLAKGTETYETALNKLQAENDKLGISTGDTTTDLRNMLGEMTNLSTISVIAQNQYEKLGKSIGWMDSQTQDALKTYQDAQKSYLEMGQKVVKAQQDIRDSQYNAAYEEIDAQVKSLSGDTDDLNKKYENEQQALQLLQEKNKLLATQQSELASLYGNTSDEVENVTKSIDDVTQSIQDMNNSLSDTQQKMEDASVSDLNSLADKLKAALKSYYDDAEKQEEASWQTKIDNNSKWKEDSESTLESVFNAKKDEIEREKTLLDRQDSDEDDNDKIAEDKKILSMNYSAKKKQEAQDDLNSILKEQNRRHQKESLDDQEAALEAQYNSDKANIDKVSQQNEDYYNSQIAQVKAFYENKEKDANLDAEAQKLIVSNNQTEIVRLLKAYGQDYELAGASLGERLVAGFKDKMYSIQEIMDGVTTQMNDIIDRVNNASLAVPAALSTISNYSNTSTYSYGSLFHANNLILNNNQDTKNLMEEMQRLADIQRMSKGVK